MFFKLYNYICGKRQSQFYLPYIETELLNEKRHIFYTDGKEGGRERCRQSYISQCVWEGPPGVLCAAGDEITVEHWRGGGHPICCALILHTHYLWNPAFVPLASSMPFFLPNSSI